MCIRDRCAGRGLRRGLFHAGDSRGSRRKADIQPDYEGFQVPDEFVVGYGLDYDEKSVSYTHLDVYKRQVLRICKICDVPAVIAVKRDATLAGSLIDALCRAGQKLSLIHISVHTLKI